MLGEGGTSKLSVGDGSKSPLWQIITTNLLLGSLLRHAGQLDSARKRLRAAVEGAEAAVEAQDRALAQFAQFELILTDLQPLVAPQGEVAHAQALKSRAVQDLNLLSKAASGKAHSFSERLLFWIEKVNSQLE